MGMVSQKLYPNTLKLTFFQHTCTIFTIIMYYVFLCRFFDFFDRDSIVVHHIFPPIHARFVRIHTLSSRAHNCMRVELYGCPIRVRRN